MGAVWTWSELTDMHLCLGLARGDAAEAKRLYLESHPDRDEPQQSVFSAVDRSLRATGRLLPERTQPQSLPVKGAKRAKMFRDLVSVAKQLSSQICPPLLVPEAAPGSSRGSAAGTSPGAAPTMGRPPETSPGSGTRSPTHEAVAVVLPDAGGVSPGVSSFSRVTLASPSDVQLHDVERTAQFPDDDVLSNILRKCSGSVGIIRLVKKSPIMPRTLPEPETPERTEREPERPSQSDDTGLPSLVDETADPAGDALEPPSSPASDIGEAEANAERHVEAVLEEEPRGDHLEPEFVDHSDSDWKSDAAPVGSRDADPLALSPAVAEQKARPRRQIIVLRVGSRPKTLAGGVGGAKNAESSKPVTNKSSDKTSSVSSKPVSSVRVPMEVISRALQNTYKRPSTRSTFVSPIKSQIVVPGTKGPQLPKSALKPTVPKICNATCTSSSESVSSEARNASSELLNASSEARSASPDSVSASSEARDASPDSVSAKSEARDATGDPQMDGIERPFLCDLCGQRFRKKEGVVSHIRREHKGEKAYACDGCDKKFDSSKDLDRHRVQHTGGNPDRPYACDKCDLAFKNRSALWGHKGVHMDTEDAKPFVCDYCSERFRRREGLTIHLRKHTGEKPFACDQCDKRFSIRANYRRHMMVHTGEKPHTCDQCGKAFIQKVQLEVHKLTHPAPDEQAELRGNALREKRRLQKKLYLPTHKHLDQTFVCEKCGKSYKKKVHLEMHLMMHSGEKPHECADCGKGFIQKVALIAHMRVHTGEKPFVCDVCGRAFRFHGDFKLHGLIHAGELPYKCDVCGMAFVAAARLKRHMMIHTGEKPHVCEVCGMAFRQKSVLKTHGKVHLPDRGRKPTLTVL